jgi:MFS family permease
MKLSVEKALQVCGNNNRYQKIFFIAVTLTWFSVDFISICFPLLELMPNFKCKNELGSWEYCDETKYCEGLNNNSQNVDVEITYHNLLTAFGLYCEKTKVILIGVIYTLGIVSGAFLCSKFSDILGRKPVLLICQLMFAIAGVCMIFSPNAYVLLIVLFLMGVACAGGTMVSYLFIYEVLSLSKRSIYGTLINSSFALAGIVYFTLFRYLQNWVYIACLCIGVDVIAGILILTYFTESPRYLISKGRIEKALKALHKIAKRNGKRKDFYKYLVSDLALSEEVIESGKSTDTEEQLCPSNKTTPKISEDSTQYTSTGRKINSNTVISSQEVDSNNSSLIKQTNNEDDSFSISESDLSLKNNLKIDEIIKNFQKAEQVEREKLIIKQEINSKNEPLLRKNTTGTHEILELTGEKKKKEAPFSSLWKYPSLRCNFLMCMFLWFGMAFTYYGISLGLKKEKDQVFIDGYIVYGAEGVSYLVTGIIISIAFFGRTRSLTIMLLLTSISTCGYFIFKYFNLEPFDKILLFSGRFSVTSIFCIMYTYSTEIYPTTIRAKGLGLNTLSARFAACLVPVVVELFDPFLIFSALCLIGFILSFKLPETFGKELEDEIQEERIISLTKEN